MPSTFECAAKNIVKELSKNGELIPMDSLKSSTHFSPYYLVRRKNKSSWFGRPQYVWLNLTLKDILDPSSPEPDRLLPDKNQKTFPPKRSGSSMESVNTGTEFEKLQAEMKKEQSPLIMLDKKLRQCLLQDLLELLQSEEGLVHLQDVLVESLFSGVLPQKSEGVMGNILSNLQDQSGQLVEELAGALLYLLGALDALSEMQYEIMIQLLKSKEKILPQQVDLVTEILKKNFFETNEVTFSLPSELLSFAKDKREESTLIYVLLKECELEISGDKSQFTWNPDALYSLYALYGSLGMLQALSKDC